MPVEVVIVSKTTCWTDSLVALWCIKRVDKKIGSFGCKRELEKLEKLLTVVFRGILLES